MPTTHFMTPRWIAALIYAIYASAGCAFLFLEPTTELESLLGELGFTTWNSLLIIGGTIGLVGALTNKQHIEFVGVPGVAVGLLVYAAFLMSQADNSPTPGIVVGFALICLGAGLGVVDRGWNLWVLGTIRDKTARRIRKGE